MLLLILPLFTDSKQKEKINANCEHAVARPDNFMSMF